MFKIFYFQRMLWTGCVQFFFDVHISVFVVMHVRAGANTVRHVEKTSPLLKNSDLQIKVVCADSTVEAYAPTCIYSYYLFFKYLYMVEMWLNILY